MKIQEGALYSSKKKDERKGIGDPITHMQNKKKSCSSTCVVLPLAKTAL